MEDISRDLIILGPISSLAGFREGRHLESVERVDFQDRLFPPGKT